MEGKYHYVGAMSAAKSPELLCLILGLVFFYTSVLRYFDVWSWPVTDENDSQKLSPLAYIATSIYSFNT